jgi:hypothetical protein
MPQSWCLWGHLGPWLWARPSSRIGGDVGGEPALLGDEPSGVKTGHIRLRSSRFLGNAGLRCGNQHRAVATIGFFEDDVDALNVDYPNLGKFARAAHEFAVYSTSNAGSLINYGSGTEPVSAFPHAWPSSR